MNRPPSIFIKQTGRVEAAGNVRQHEARADEQLVFVIADGVHPAILTPANAESIVTTFRAPPRREATEGDAGPIPGVPGGRA